jgi:hypothetical protein
MEINASSTCKYLKDRRKRVQPDLRERCCDLRLLAMNPNDSKVLTALYHVYTYGGKISVESKDLKVSAEMGGFLEGRDGK